MSEHDRIEAFKRLSSVESYFGDNIILQNNTHKAVNPVHCIPLQFDHINSGYKLVLESYGKRKPIHDKYHTLNQKLNLSLLNYNIMNNFCRIDLFEQLKNSEMDGTFSDTLLDHDCHNWHFLFKVFIAGCWKFQFSKFPFS